MAIKEEVCWSIEGLIKDVSAICLSYLTSDEQIYMKKEWEKFNKDNVCDIAAENGWLDLLIWARHPKRKYCWDIYTCSYAAENGHLEVLKWARQNGCAWDSMTCSWTAYNGHLEVLKWARQNGCDWDNWTCSSAALNGHLLTLKWLKENNCPCGGDTRYHKD
jgi:hypothetical protein